MGCYGRTSRNLSGSSLSGGTQVRPPLRASPGGSLAEIYRPLAADKNPHRLQESTLYFSRLQEAYETLSDPQERAYYDRRRQQASLRTEPPDVSAQDFDDVLAGKKAYGRPVKKTRGLGVRELERFFDKGIWRKGGMSDANGVRPKATKHFSLWPVTDRFIFLFCVLQGFYQIYATLFAHLSQEESLHADVPQPPYPVFGDSNTPWSLPDRTIIQVRIFSSFMNLSLA